MRFVPTTDGLRLALHEHGVRPLRATRGTSELAASVVAFDTSLT